MEVKLVIIITVVLGVTAAVQGSYRDLKLIKKAASCIMNIIPHEDMMSGNDFLYDYIVNISYQWDPLNHHDYLHWWKYDGPEAWRAGCHFNDTIHQCLQPVMEKKINLNKYSKGKPDMTIYSTMIVQSLYYLILCENQAVLAENAVCIHNRMLSDDVLRCSGVFGWKRGNYLMYDNKQYETGPDVSYMVYNSLASVNIAVYQCIYTRGQWKRACGKSVDETIRKIVNKFTGIVKGFMTFATIYQSRNHVICDRCKEGSKFKPFRIFNFMKIRLFQSLLYDNQSPYLFKECHLVDYPLNHCHIKNTWRRDVFNMFCHQVTNIMAPQLEPYLPLCDFDEWIQSAERICNMGYDRFMDLAGHTEHCTDGKDELFPCYKGLYIDMQMSWGLLTASRLWWFASFNKLGATYRAIYPRIKQCSKLVYAHLSKTCRHGPPVVRLIQDIRTVLSISQSDINSHGLLWQVAHKYMKDDKAQVLQC